MADAADVKEALKARIGDLVRELAPDCRRNGKYWIGRSPLREDRHAGSFWIVINGAAAGAWRDEATGDTGDIFGLIARVHGFSQFNDTIGWAKRWLNYEDVPAPRRAAVKAQRQAERAARDLADMQEIADLRKKALAHWLRCTPGLEGTPAERYLATRGIAYRALKRAPRALRFEPGARHVESEARFPAICALLTGPDGACWGIHRTFLANDGTDKAPVSPARKIWPHGWAGSFIPLARGETDMPPAAAAKHGLIDRLILCEGVEDGLSLALACPDLRVWAACSVGNLARIALPACCDTALVAADNDWGKPGAQAQLEAGVRALVAQGRSVQIARSHVGKDVNDALRS